MPWMLHTLRPCNMYGQMSGRKVELVNQKAVVHTEGNALDGPHTSTLKYIVLIHKKFVNF